MESTLEEFERKENGLQAYHLGDEEQDDVIGEERLSPRGESPSANAGAYCEGVPPDSGATRHVANRGASGSALSPALLVRSPERYQARPQAASGTGLGPKTPTVDIRGSGANMAHRWSPAASSYTGVKSTPLSFAAEAERELQRMEHGLDCLAGWSPMAVSSSPTGMYSHARRPSRMHKRGQGRLWASLNC